MATAKIPFRTMFDPTESEGNPTGTEYDVTRMEILDSKGNKKLEITGKTNRFEKIQSFKDECLIENILAKLATDPNALNQVQRNYGDQSVEPKTLMEAQNMMIRLTNEFKSLPMEYQRKFDKDPNKYIAEYATKEWVEKMSIPEEKPEKTEEGEKE